MHDYYCGSCGKLTNIGDMYECPDCDHQFCVECLGEAHGICPICSSEEVEAMN